MLIVSTLNRHPMDVEVMLVQIIKTVVVAVHVYKIMSCARQIPFVYVNHIRTERFASLQQMDILYHSTPFSVRIFGRPHEEF